MKGLSPLIAAVLLLAIAFSVAAIISPWALRLVESDTTDLSNKSSTITGCNVVNVDNVYLDFVDDIGRVYVVSRGDAVITSAGITTTKGVSMPLKDPSVLPITMSTGNRKLLEFNLTVNLTTCTNFSKVSVVTACMTDEETKADNC